MNTLTRGHSQQWMETYDKASTENDPQASTKKEKASTFEIFSVQDQRGIARWQSKFAVIESGKRPALDCLFVVEFDEEELCPTFREWWHVQEI